MNKTKRGEYDRVRRGTGPGDFHVNREQVFRDLFTDPRASAIFEEPLALSAGGWACASTATTSRPPSSEVAR